MGRFIRRFSGLAVLVLLAGCGRFFEDNGTHLAYALEKGASDLRASPAPELAVRYELLDGPDVTYYVEITPTYANPAQTSGPWGSYIVVSGKSHGGTSYHNRFVFVPRRLYLEQARGATELTLRKDGDRIDVVAARRVP